MTGFDKDCPICKKKFSSLLEYTTHLGKDHSDIPIERILKMDKEDKWSMADK
ncbi:MAG: hypothetical protein KGH88_01320 [Thaumarchaeota archaeon]|nr:hypothetical protein [Nitrososphaerota archaeon]